MGFAQDNSERSNKISWDQQMHAQLLSCDDELVQESI